jgi:Flp pilus assembly protein TadG
MIRQRRNRQHAHWGIALVEFVLVAPIMLLMMLAVAELGRALYQYNTLTKAVYAGARYYAANVLTVDVTNPAALEVINANTRNLVKFGNINGTGDLLLDPAPTVTPTYIPNFGVTVSADYTFTFIPGDPLSGIMILLGGAGVPTPFVLTSTVTLRAI